MQRRFIKFGKRVVKKKKPSHKPFKNWTIVTGDHVYILDGRDRGKDGIVTKVIRRKNRVVVGGLNLAKRRVAPNQQFKGGIISVEAPMHVSNVNLVDPASVGSDTGPLPTRVGLKFLPNGRKLRYAKRSGVAIPKPQLTPKDPERLKLGPKDTTTDDVIEQTFTGLTLDTQLFDYLGDDGQFGRTSEV